MGGASGTGGNLDGVEGLIARSSLARTTPEEMAEVHRRLERDRRDRMVRLAVSLTLVAVAVAVAVVVVALVTALADP